MKKIVLFGNGKIAEVAYYYLTNDSPYEIAAFTVDKEYIHQEKMLGLPVIPFDNIEKEYPTADYGMLVAIGYQKLNKLRAEKYQEAKNKGYKLVSYISSKLGNFGNVKIGDNCFILENQAIQPCSQIGDNVTIWSGNHIGHHSTIKDHCFITSQVVISGNTVIEPYCFIGVNATIGHEITVGEQSFIGAGSIITKNTDKKSVYIAKDTDKYKLNSDYFVRFTNL